MKDDLSEAQRDLLYHSTSPHRATLLKAIDELYALRAQQEAIGAVLSENGCECGCDHHRDECDAECEEDRCLGCRVEKAMKS